jgi:hypothetical protein
MILDPAALPTNRISGILKTSRRCAARPLEALEAPMMADEQHYPRTSFHRLQIDANALPGSSRMPQYCVRHVVGKNIAAEYGPYSTPGGGGSFFLPPQAKSYLT